MRSRSNSNDFASGLLPSANPYILLSIPHDALRNGIETDAIVLSEHGARTVAAEVRSFAERLWSKTAGRSSNW